MEHLTPKQIVSELDTYIVGQTDAKRAVAIADRHPVGCLPRHDGLMYVI